VRLTLDEPSGPNDITVAFLGYSTGLVGGVDPVKVNPKVLYGILKAGAPLTDPSTLYKIGEYFFVIKMTDVIQRREWFTTVRESLPPATRNGSLVRQRKPQGVLH
jgi:p-aminobenzoyl-glutamate transporter AbgT